MDREAVAERLAAWAADRAAGGTTNTYAAVLRRQMAGPAPDPDPETIRPTEDFL